MKRSVYTFRNVLLLLLATVALTTCTIIDNDLRDLPDIPGFKEMVVEDGENYHLEYQFKEEVNYIDKNFLIYVANIDYDNELLYLYDYIPSDLRPQKGDLLFAPSTNKLNYGLTHRVSEITKVNNLYVVNLTHAPMEDVYKHLVLKGDFDFDGESQTDSVSINEVRSITRSGESDDENRKEVQVNTDEFETPVEDENKWNYLSLFQFINGNYDDDSAERLIPYIFTAPENITAEFLSSNATSVTLKKKGKGKADWISGEAEINGSLFIRWRPVCKTSVDINTQKEYSDMKTSVGIEVEQFWDISGYADIEFHLLELLRQKLKRELKIKIPVNAAINLWLTVEPDVDVLVGVEGNFRALVKKTYYMNFGSRKGVAGKSEGVYIEPENPPLELEQLQQTSSTTETSGKLDGYIAVYGVITAKFGFGAPVGDFFCGIVVTAKIGPKFSLTLMSSEPYDDSFNINIHFEIIGKACLDLTKFLTFTWYFLDDLKRLFSDGRERGQLQDESHFMYEKDWTIYTSKAYPQIDNFKVTCPNGLPGETPQFTLLYEIKDHGFTETSDKFAYPVMKIYKVGDPEHPLISGDPGHALTKSTKQYVITRDLNRIKTSTADFDRLSIYACEIDMRRGKIGNEQGQTWSLYKKTFYFCAKPIAFISSHDVTYMGSKQEYRDGTTAITLKEPTLWDWIFRTVLVFTDYKKTKGLVFYVDNEDIYDLGSSFIPTQEKIQVIWKVKNAKNRVTMPVIFPTIFDNDARQTIGPEYYVRLDYDEFKDKKDPEFGMGVGENGGMIIDHFTNQKDWRYRKEKINGKWYYVTGFDKEMFMSKKNIPVAQQAAGARSMRSADINDDDEMTIEDGMPTLVVEIDN